MLWASSSAKPIRRISVYFWRGRPNWGDLLTPLLLKHFCNMEATWAPFPDAEMVGVGSVLDHVPRGWNGTIVGSGKLHEESLLPVGRGRILALRGPLTAKGVRGDFAIGDLGLLANELVLVDTKKYDLGIVPHWMDRRLGSDQRFAKYNPVVIDPRGDPLDVIHTIGQCRKIVTSGLHGMILADAFGIPRRWEYATQAHSEGGDFKFRDYSASIRTPLEQGVTVLASHQAVDDRKSELYDVLRAL